MQGFSKPFDRFPGRRYNASYGGRLKTWQECTDGEVRAVLKYMQTGLAPDVAADLAGLTLEDVKSLIAATSTDKAERDPKAVQTAKWALQYGIPPDAVAKFTGLAVDELKDLL